MPSTCNRDIYKNLNSRAPHEPERSGTAATANERGDAARAAAAIQNINSSAQERRGTTAAANEPEGAAAANERVERAARTAAANQREFLHAYTAPTLTQAKRSYAGYTIRQGMAIILEHSFMIRTNSEKFTALTSVSDQKEALGQSISVLEYNRGN